MIDLSDKKALVIDYRNGISVAQRLAEEFGTVFYWAGPYVHNGFPEHSSFDVGYNVPNIVKVREWVEGYDEADIVVFTDSMDPALQDWMKRNGKPVFGSCYAEQLEHNRLQIKETLKQLGLPVASYSVARGVDELEQILMNAKEGYIKSSLRGNGETWKHKEWALSKRQLQKLRYDMGLYENRETYIFEHPVEGIIEFGYDGFIVGGQYVHESMCGIELKDRAYLGRFIRYQHLPEPIRKVNDAFAPVFNDMGYNGHYSNEIILSKDKRPFLLDNTCFSDDTEVLTDKGWKFFFELDGSERVCTLNPDTNKIEYHVPYIHGSYTYKGDLISISNRRKTIECLVTPNHNVWRTDRFGKNLRPERADSLTDKGYIPRVAEWAAKDVEFFELPEYKREWDFVGGSNGVTHFVCKKIKHSVARKIKMDSWVKFMAWFLSEGSVGGRAYNKDRISNCVNICQVKFKTELMSVLDECGFVYKFNSKSKTFQINDIQLASYLAMFGKCNKKYIPEYIKNCSKRQIRLFLDNYIMGDGDSREKRKYFTTSKDIANDIQELLLKAGSVGSISVKKIAGTTVNGLPGEYTRNHDLYVIGESKKNGRFWFETGSIRKNQYINTVPYDGIVYDVTVKNHILYVRRNGKPFFSGNCRFPSPPGELLLLAYKNYPEIVWRIAHGEMPVIQYEHEWGAQLILKSEIAEEDPSPILVPEEFKKYVKIKSLSIDSDGTWYYIPAPSLRMNEIGSVVYTADTMEEAIKGVIEVAESIKGFDTSFDADALPEAKKCLDKLKKAGVNFI